MEQWALCGVGCHQGGEGGDSRAMHFYLSQRISVALQRGQDEVAMVGSGNVADSDFRCASMHARGGRFVTSFFAFFSFFLLF